MTIRLAVLGTGRIGRMHAELIDREIPGIELGSVFDVVADSAQSVATELGVTAAASLDAALADPSIDAVCIATSTDTHVDTMIAVAEAGKHIFLEKPISLDLGEVDRGLAAVEAAGVSLQIGFNRRFDPGHAAVRSAVADGSVGDLHLVRITSRDPAPPPISYVEVSGGIFRDMMIHDFDMARFITGSEVVDVTAKAAVRIDPAIGAAGDYDTAVVVLTHADGTITTIDNSRQAVYGYDQRVEAFGSAGMATSENQLMNNSRVSTATGTVEQPLQYFFLERYIPSYIAEWKAFATAVADGVAPPVSGNDGRAPLLIAQAALQSIDEGRTVGLADLE